jgi:hypothetical protein
VVPLYVVIIVHQQTGQKNDRVDAPPRVLFVVVVMHRRTTSFTAEMKTNIAPYFKRTNQMRSI